MPGKMKIIIDCDPGVDDMQTILLALAAKHVEVIAITTCFGNSAAHQTFLDAKKILYLCDRIDIPVYQGTKVNLFGMEKTPNKSYEEKSLFGMDLNFVDTWPEPTMSSSEALVYYANRYPGEIHLIAIAPLTNLAVAYLWDNTFAEKLASLSVMGGDRNEISVRNNMPGAEFNCWCDPPAWKLVMSNFKLLNSKKINLIDLAFCMRNLFSVTFHESYFNSSDADDPNNKKAFLTKKSYNWAKQSWKMFGENTCDPFALFVAIYPEFEVTGTSCVIENVSMEVDSFGYTRLRPNDNGNILLIEEVDMFNFSRLLLESIKPL